MPLIHTEFKQNNTIQSSFHINTISAMMHFIYIIYMSVYTEQIMQDISTLTHHIYFTIFKLTNCSMSSVGINMSNVQKTTNTLSAVCVYYIVR